MLTDILRKYQRYDPETGRFDVDRSIGEYGRVLGVSQPQMSLIYSGARNPGMSVMRRLARTFPAAAPEIVAAMSAPVAVPA